MQLLPNGQIEDAHSINWTSQQPEEYPEYVHRQGDASVVTDEKGQ